MNCCRVLLREPEWRFHIGSTGDLRARLQKHSSGVVRSTAPRQPLRVIYYEPCWSMDDARRRERYLETGRGGRYLKQRLAFWLAAIRSNKLERH